VLAAVLAGVLRGLEQQAEPTAATVGNAYVQTSPALPVTWEAAIKSFRDGQLLPEWFGQRFCTLFAACRESERDRFHSRVTPTEYEWYLTTV